MWWMLQCAPSKWQLKNLTAVLPNEVRPVQAPRHELQDKQHLVPLVEVRGPGRLRDRLYHLQVQAVQPGAITCLLDQLSQQ